MGLLDLLDKAYSKLQDNAPMIVDKMTTAMERAEEKQLKTDEKVKSYVSSYDYLTMKKLKEELLRLNNSNESDANIRKRAISDILNDRQNRIRNLIRDYSSYQSSTLKLEHTCVSNGRSNYCVISNNINQKLTDVEIEMRLIAIEKVLSERKNSE